MNRPIKTLEDETARIAAKSIIALSAAALLLAACRGTMIDCDKHDSMHPECRRGSCIAVPGNVCQR